MGYRTMSIRIRKEVYDFVKVLAKEGQGDLSSAVRDLIDKGRVHLAIEEYKTERASLGRAARLAGLSVSEMIDILSEYGIESNLDEEDYRMSLKALRNVY